MYKGDKKSSKMISQMESKMTAKREIVEGGGIGEKGLMYMDNSAVIAGGSWV